MDVKHIISGLYYLTGLYAGIDITLFEKMYKSGNKKREALRLPL